MIISETLLGQTALHAIKKAYAAQEGCPPSVDCDYVDRVLKEGLSAAGPVIGSIETSYSIWESDYDHENYITTKGVYKPILKLNGDYRSQRAQHFAMLSRRVTRVGLGLSTLSWTIGGTQMYYQSQAGEQISPVDVVQFGVGTVGTGASWLNYLGLGGKWAGRISGGAGILGVALSIPSSWYEVYKGFYELEFVPSPYPEYMSDSEAFGGN